MTFSGAEIRSVCTEAGMFAIRARRKVITEQDFLEVYIIYVVIKYCLIYI
jgi:ATP-dependent 26S proteasome regulatory subunit